ncbi:MAG: prolipoprotein diacylglyceryl transferase [Ardenticatenaceae bacterium]|nr:prolipoprotein diacylglyceryl transferase [Ardenticatenaceae bacterium]
MAGRVLTAALFVIFLAAYIVHLLTGFHFESQVGQLFGAVDIYWRGVLASAAVFWGIVVAVTEQRRIDPSFDWWAVLRYLPLILLGGVVGGRLGALLLPMPSLAASGITSLGDAVNLLPVALNLRQGGLALAGVIVGGGMVLGWYGGLRYGTIMGLLAGQQILIWANFVEQSYFGPPTSLFWGMAVEEIYRLPQWAAFSRFHPLFLYEAIVLLAIFLILPRLNASGDFWGAFAWYLAIYGLAKGIFSLFDPNSFVTVWIGVMWNGWTIVWFGGALAGWFLIGWAHLKD